jgi:hypothetical protein
MEGIVGNGLVRGDDWQAEKAILGEVTNITTARNLKK